MGVPVLILGESGSGKSASLRNFEPNEIGILNVAAKPLPFRKKMNVISTIPYKDGDTTKRRRVDYADIMGIIERNNGKLKAFAIDDSQYLMCFEAFAKAKETGYEKYTDMALHFYNLVQFVIQQTPPDVIVYFLHHTDQDSNTGKIRAKTLGKMLDNKLTVEGLFSIVLLCWTDGKKHIFQTQSDGLTTCKSPMGLFDSEIDNDLKIVDTKIREYYELGKKQ